MALWRFRDYCTTEDRFLIREWYAVQDGAVKAAFDMTLRLLSNQREWKGRREFKVLDGPHSGLSELRFNLDVYNPTTRRQSKRRFRPVGLWRPEVREFILFLGCEKSGRMSIPPNAFDLALKYLAEFNAGKGTIHEHI